MNNFDDLEQGDEVAVGMGRSYFAIRKVVRTTPTQVVLEGDIRFSRETGYSVPRNGVKLSMFLGGRWMRSAYVDRICLVNEKVREEVAAYEKSLAEGEYRKSLLVQARILSDTLGNFYERNSLSNEVLEKLAEVSTLVNIELESK